MKKHCLRWLSLALICGMPLLAIAQNGVVRAKEFGANVENDYKRVIRTGSNYTALLYGLNAATSILVTYDAGFNIVWQNNIGPLIEDISPTSDGGVIAAGQTTANEFKIVKVNAAGTTQWTRTYGGTGVDKFLAVRQKSNGNYLSLGYTSSNDGDILNKTTTDFDLFLAEFDAAGNLVDQKVFGGTNNENNVSFEFTPDGGLMLAGGTYSNDGIITGNHGNEDIWLVKLDAAYNVQWNKCIGGSGDEFPNTIYRDEANDYILSGQTNSTNGDINGSGTFTDGLIMKIDPSGNIKWLRVIYGTYYDYVQSAKPLPGGDIILTGQTMSDNLFGVPRPSGLNFMDAFLLRYNTDGHMIWGRRIGGSADEKGSDVLMADNGNFIVTGFKWFNGYDGDWTGVTPSGGESRAFILEMRNLNVIKGIVFYDDNNNKIQDPGELSYSESPVYATKGSYRLNQTPVDGNFSLAVDSGSYVTQLDGSSINGGQYRFTPKRKNTYFPGSGQKDSFAIRIAPIALVEDLEIHVQRLTPAYLDHSVKYRVRVSNLGGKTVTNRSVKLVPDNKVSFHSSAAGLPTVVGDTLVWARPDLPQFETDSFDVTFFTRSIPDIQPGAVSILTSIAEPYATDFDTLDNKTMNATIVEGQNSAITNVFFSMGAYDSARFNQTIPYYIYYGFTSKLDSTKGFVRFVKSPNTEFVSANYTPSSIVADTIYWNFKDLNYGDLDTIIVNMKTIEGGGLQPGDHMYFSGQLRFLTADTSILQRDFSFVKQVTGYFVEPDNTNTPLSPPHGIRWTRAFGGTNDETAYDVVALPDSGFIVVGSTSSRNFDMSGAPDTSTNGFLGRFDKDGHLLWKHIIGGPRGDALLQVVESSPGIFYAMGNYQNAPGNSNIWIVKFNSNGDTLWTKNYGGTLADNAGAVLATADGGCLFTATTTSSDGDVHDYEVPPTGVDFPPNMWLVKLDANGTQQWDSCYSGANHAYLPYDIKRTNDDKIVVVGQSARLENAQIEFGGYLFVLNNDGTRVSEKVYETFGLRHWIYSIVVNEDNSFTFLGTGTTDPSLPADTAYSGIHGQNDVWTARVDNTGNIIWQKHFGGTSSEVGERIITTSDGNYVIAAYSQSNNGNVTSIPNTMANGWLFKIDPAGNLLWQKTMGGSKQEALYSVAELADRSLLATGYTASNDGDISDYHGGGTDMLLVKIGVSNFITGTVFIDLNNNSIKEANEPFYSSGVVKAVSATKEYTGIVIDGQYQMSVDTGDFVLKFQTVDSTYFDILPASANISFNELSQTAEAHFRLVKKDDINDLRLDILPLGVARPGFTISYRVNYENRGTVPSSPVTIRIKPDARTTYMGSTLTPSSVANDTLIWIIPTLNIFESGNFDILIRVLPPPTNNNGDSVRLYGEILPVAVDSTPENNIAVVRQIVQGSYDPNDKIEVHGNTLPFNFIENEEYLTYVIRFQNTGTDTAFNVYVRDTLSAQFDWNSFEMIDASHPYEFSVQNGNTMEWYFRDIYLPDSNVNEPGSHGFIAFRIKPRSDLGIGDSVSNDAGIYFDFNLPVQTNLMLSTIGPPVALPSTILQFSATWKQESVQLKWLVTNESKVMHYVVEHSENGSQFSAIGQLAATNASIAHTYEFIHTAPVFGNNYYRLKVVDIDGKTVYSKTITLKKDGDLITSLKIYPVPAAKGPVTVKIEGRVKGVGTLAIYKVDGTLIQSRPLGNIDQVNYRFTIDANTLSGGVYILNCTIGGRTYLGKLIVE